MSDDTVFLLRGLGFLIGGVFFWLMYFDLKDRLQPEPRRSLVAVFLAGVASAVLALALFRLGELLGLPEDPGFDVAGIALYSFLLIGPIEEGAKFLAAKATFDRWRSFDEPVDGYIYAAVLAIGFATLENLLYLNWLTWQEQLARFLSSPLSHSLFAVIWGYGLAHARFFARTRAQRWLWQGGTLAASMALHGFYDFALFAWHATVVSGLLALVLWGLMVVHIRRLLARAAAAPVPQPAPVPEAVEREPEV